MISIVRDNARRSGIATQCAGDMHWRESVAVPLAVILDQDALAGPDQRGEPARAPLRRRLAQPSRARLDHLALELWHSRRRCSIAWREGEDVRRDDVAIIEQFK